MSFPNFVTDDENCLSRHIALPIFRSARDTFTGRVQDQHMLMLQNFKRVSIISGNGGHLPFNIAIDLETFIKLLL